ncbi:MAG: histidine kinase dimerization/phospho-acceptor domain-containing protein [Candidatus Phaeomarinobacter sp.]
MADAHDDLTEPTDPLRRGLRPAASQDVVSRRTLDIAVVAAGAMACVLVAGFFGLLSMDAAVLMAAAIAAFAVAWLRLAPRTAPAVRRGDLPIARPVATRSEFPLTPETGVAIIERLPDPIILLDRSGRIILHNRAAMNIVGQGAARRHISTVMRVPQVLEAVAHVVDGEAAQVVEYMQPVPIERHYHAFIAPVMAAARDKAKESQRNVLILLHDLTTLKRAEQMRADFVANASHELRTPLASMSGFVDTLQGPARDDPVARD